MDVQAVLNAVAKTAARLCDANDAMIWQVEGDELRLVAKHGSLRTTFAVGELQPISRGSPYGRAVADRKTIHIRDLAVAVRREFKEIAPRQRATGIRTSLAMPMLRRSVPIGVIVIRRTKVRPFTAHQIALLKTFADQAAIAIENARLNVDLSEALEQQTATSEVLRVISSSQTDVQPVFDTIAESAVRLCDARYSAVFRFDGKLLHFVAHHNLPPEGVEAYHRAYPMAPGRGSAAARSILNRALEHIPDLWVEPGYAHGALARALSLRSIVAVPMLRDGQPIGAIAVSRTETGFFSERQIELLKTFADQAVIAIENVRLFQELQARNRDLTEALEQQTATAEILRVISGSPTDLEPVFQSILANALRLCSAELGTLFRYDSERFEAVAFLGALPAAAADLRGRYRYMAVGPKTALGRLVAGGRRPVHILDIMDDDAYREGDPTRVWTVDVLGARTFLAVPMLKENTLIGAVVIYRHEVRPFTDKQMELVGTFADQAVIAIENVRLFQELQARNRDLTEALEQQTATSEILQVISSSPTDLQPVLDSVAQNAARVCGAFDSTLLLIDQEALRVAAHYGPKGVFP